MYGYTVQSGVAVMRARIPDDYTGPSITEQPLDWTGAYGEYTNVYVEADGYGLTYAWYYRTAKSTTWKLSSKKTSVLKIKFSKTYNGMQVYCVRQSRKQCTERDCNVAFDR